MKLDFRCPKCGSADFLVKTAVFPEKNAKLKLEFGTYYLKICADCGYTPDVLSQSRKQRLKGKRCPYT